MCLKQQSALKRTWAFMLETKAKSYCLALVLHCSPAPCVSPPMAPSHSLLHALDWSVPLQQQPAYLWDWPFAKDLCSSRGFKQKAFRESGLPSTGKLCAVLQHFIALLGILGNHSFFLHLTSCSLYMIHSRKPMKLQLFWKQCLWKWGPNTSTKVANLPQFEVFKEIVSQNSFRILLL